MPGPVLHTGAVAMCPHGAPLNIIASSPRIMVSGMPAAVLTDQGMITGCPFQLPAAPSPIPAPCMTTQWMVGATRVMADGVPLLINPCTAICISVQQIPAGPPVIASSQMMVIAT